MIYDIEMRYFTHVDQQVLAEFILCQSSSVKIFPTFPVEASGLTQSLPYNKFTVVVWKRVKR
jgi:hypothetical protein